MIEEETLSLVGLDCAECAGNLERGIKDLTGIHEVQVNFGSSRMRVRFDSDKVTRADITTRVRDLGYGVMKPVPGSFLETHRRVVVTGAAGLLLGAGWLATALGVPVTTGRALYLAAIAVGGYWTARKGLYSLRRLAFDMNVLMTIAVTGAALIGEWFEGATVAFLYSVSHMLESFTMERARSSIRSLMDLAPEEALVKRNGNEVEIAVEELEVGDIVIVKPGEKIPMDGRVVAGRSTVNQAPITGESMPVEKEVGDEVYAGTMNQLGTFEFEVTRLVADTTLSKIIHLVEEAQAGKAPSQAFVDRFARYYTPAVMALAAGIATLPPGLFGLPWGPWIYRGLALLVVACPCALVISTPVSIVSAVGNAARNGVLIKGGVYLEEAGTISVVAFDKTGTLTRGRPEVTDVFPSACVDRRRMLAVAVGLEARSEHPVAEALCRRAQIENIEMPEVMGFEAITGKGVKGKIDGKEYYIGNPRLFLELGVDTSGMETQLAELQEQGKTVMVVGAGNELLGIIAIADEVRHGTGAAIRGLKAAGVERTVMLTGDNQRTAKAIAEALGLDAFRAELLPEDKVRAIKELIAEHGKVAMVGDGINDAPALAAATVGIAMGAAGTDAALETADIALMADDLSRLAYAIRLSRRALRVIKQNIAFSLIIKFLAVAAVFPGWLTLLIAVLADTGAALIVTLNGMRLVRQDLCRL